MLRKDRYGPLAEMTSLVMDRAAINEIKSPIKAEKKDRYRLFFIQARKLALVKISM
jgi:hypothetical protein